MKNENDALRKQVENLTSTLANFTQGRDDLDFLLRGQNKSLSKSGLGFNCVEKQKLNKHVNQSSMYSCFSTCNFCNKKGHLSHKYRLKKNSIPKNMLWVLKGTMPNKQGLNIKRVSKNASHMNSRNIGARKVFQQRRNMSHEQARP